MWSKNLRHSRQRLGNCGELGGINPGADFVFRLVVAADKLIPIRWQGVKEKLLFYALPALLRILQLGFDLLNFGSSIAIVFLGIYPPHRWMLVYDFVLRQSVAGGDKQLDVP